MKSVAFARRVARCSSNHPPLPAAAAGGRGGGGGQHFPLPLRDRGGRWSQREAAVEGALRVCGLSLLHAALTLKRLRLPRQHNRTRLRKEAYRRLLCQALVSSARLLVSSARLLVSSAERGCSCPAV